MKARLLLLAFWLVCLLAAPLILLWQLALIPLNPARSLLVARAIDEAGATALFGSTLKTISYKCARAAQDGKRWAIALCEALNVISPEHCKSALDGTDLTLTNI